MISLGLAACGQDDVDTQAAAGTTEPSTATETTPVETTTTATTPSTTSTTTGTAPNTGGTPAGEPDSSTGGASAQPDEGGDEAGNSVPVAVNITGNGTVSPASVTVPSFFNVVLTVRSVQNPAVVTVERDGKPDLKFTVEPGDLTRKTVGSLAPGNYDIKVQGGGTTTIRSVSGGAGGP